MQQNIISRMENIIKMEAKKIGRFKLITGAIANGMVPYRRSVLNMGKMRARPRSIHQAYASIIFG